MTTMLPPAATAEIVAAVRAHADAHRATGGWDVVTDHWTDADIAGAIGRDTTAEAVITKVGRWVGTFDDVRRTGVIDRKA